MEIEKGIIDRGLGEEIWLKIFGYLPKSDRANVRLVNSLFNKLICEIEKFKYVLRVTYENLTDIGILMTKRKFNEIKFDGIPLNDLNLTVMCDILRVHGKYIETMTISDEFCLMRRHFANLLRGNKQNAPAPEVKTIAAYRVLSLFQCVPNLKKLIWNQPEIQIDKWFAHDSLLEKLEYLQLRIHEGTSLEFAYIFTPGTIKAFKFGLKWKYLKEFLACQSNIKDLILEQFDTNSDINVLNQLKLDSLMFDSTVPVPFLIQMFRQHPELKRVEDLYRDCQQLDLIRAYFELENLEYIELALNDQHLNEIRRITELKKLKEVKFGLCFTNSADNLLQFASIQLQDVEKITLTGYRFTGALILETAGQNWPNVKHLDIEIPSKFDNGIDVINYYLDSFNQLESLVLKTADRFYYDYYYRGEDDDELHNKIGHGIIPFEMFSFISHSIQYPHLKSLTVHGAGILHLEHLLTALPNLELLHVNGFYSSICTTHCLITLAKHKKLKDLNIKITEQSKFARFSAQEENLLKKLCRRLKSFKITFGGHKDFHESIRNLLRGCDTFTIQTRGGDDEYEYKSTILENVKY